MFSLKMVTEFSLRNVVLLSKYRTMDNVQNCDSYLVLWPFNIIICNRKEIAK
jgi:hypothetical protein